MVRTSNTIGVLALVLNLNMVNAQDVTESPTSTVKGSAQIEVATSYENFSEGLLKNESYTLASLLVLYGISDAVELRLGWNSQNETTSINGVRQRGFGIGFTPLQIGVGADVVQENGIQPRITAIVDVFFPFAAGSEFKTKNIGGLVLGGFYHTLGKYSALNYNFGVQFGDDEVDYAYLYTLAYLQGFNSVWGFYLELSGDFPKRFDDRHFGNLGLYVMVTPNIQFDAIIGTGWYAEQDIYLTARLAITIPNSKHRAM